jgi:hypothetical protein
MFFCLNSDCQNHTAKGSDWYVKTGYYKPKGSGQRTARYKCKECGKTFSSNTHRPTAYQKKRAINPRLFKLLVSGVSLRRAAELLEVQYNTVLLHFDYLAEAAKRACIPGFAACTGRKTTLRPTYCHWVVAAVRTTP